MINTCFKSSINEKIRYICNNNYNYFFNKKNIVGIGLGYKTIRNFTTHEKCIIVFVTKKLPQNNIHWKDLIPALYNGVKTDVVESGVFEATSFTKKIRPTQGGYSISVGSKNPTGTLCCLVKDTSNLYILSCNHVIALQNTAPISAPITQPGYKDSGNPSTDTVAYLSKYIPLQYYSPIHPVANDVDCAIAKVTDLSLVSKNIATIGPLLGLTTPSLDLSVRKIGRTTGITYGHISAIYVTIKYKFYGKEIIFRNQIYASTASDKGDSGSIVEDLQNKAVAMLIAGNRKGASLCTPMYSILNLLKVSLVM
ncbi:hypothetical protein G8V03_14695 [Clostridium botulinum D/C]|uniref:S1 family peptidase n=1 Tax=Clostridium botulinum TaxID=1491 RepID=UPI001E509A5E|nr:S1 family peptidase [Clostridium botulinum]MCD3352177.1 hypothetical protein [Clostridium botulinum D/C]MCD3361144.1 hypothetical protein [Clostridium botulinum D/C]MCD3363636.1 hypothetical protein [Clostridium botulinum D/C]MCD3366883.1 hypothetical protein [Clostridium botulinum D/C]